jgi:hypothetical protein
MRNEHTSSVREHLIVALELVNPETSDPGPERRGEDENEASKYTSALLRRNHVDCSGALTAV